LRRHLPDKRHIARMAVEVILDFSLHPDFNPADTKTAALSGPAIRTVAAKTSKYLYKRFSKVSPWNCNLG
jgi:hypothetical protein